MVNVNNSSANSSSNALGSLEKKSVKSMDRNSIRSQSLLEIGGGQKSGSRSSSHPPNLRSYSSSGLIGGLGTNQDQNNVNVIQGERRKNTLTKMKGLVIPETESPSTSNQSKTLTSPPWKDESNNFPKYSPAFKRKPFSVLGQSEIRGQTSNNDSQTQQTQNNNGGSKNTTQQQIDSTNVMHQKQNHQNNHVVKSDDSDNDSAVSSGRSSLSHSSVSPPSSPKSNGKSGLRNSSSDPRSTADSSTESADLKNPRILKKDSIEAINRRNILNSCKKSNAKTKMGDLVKNPSNGTTTPHWNGKPASRSSSFTIAERKKSFETMQTNIRSLGESAKVNTHSSQDSLSRKSSRECESGFTSRRPSSNSELPIQSSSNSSRRGTCSSHVFTNPICNYVFKKKLYFS